MIDNLYITVLGLFHYQSFFIQPLESQVVHFLHRCLIVVRLHVLTLVMGYCVRFEVVGTQGNPVSRRLRHVLELGCPQHVLVSGGLSGDLLALLLRFAE